jgi:hypothetical protein
MRLGDDRLEKPLVHSIPCGWLVLVPRNNHAAEIACVRPSLGGGDVGDQPIRRDEHVVIGPEQQLSGRLTDGPVSSIRKPDLRFDEPTNGQPIRVALDYGRRLVRRIVVDNQQLPS